MARPLPISHTGLGRTRGGVSCEAIPVPPDPSPSASPEERNARYDAQDHALAQQEACYDKRVQDLKTSVAETSAARKALGALLGR